MLGPTTLFWLPRDYLVLKGFIYAQRSSSNRILNKINFRSFYNRCFCDYAFQKLATIRITASAVDLTFSPSLKVLVRKFLREKGDESRIAHNISRKYEIDDKFTEVRGKFCRFSSITLWKRISTTTSRHNKRSIICTTTKENRFYHEKVSLVCNSYKTECKIFLAKHSKIDLKKIWVRQYLLNVLLNGIVAEEIFDFSEALKKLQDVIVKFFPQVPVSYRSEEAKDE